MPDNQTLSRRLNKLSVELPFVPKDQAVHVVVDKGRGQSIRTRGAESSRLMELVSDKDGLCCIWESIRELDR